MLKFKKGDRVRDVDPPHSVGTVAVVDAGHGLYPYLVTQDSGGSYWVQEGMISAHKGELTDGDCMLLAGYAKLRQLDGETEIPRALLDLAARISKSIGDAEMADKLSKMRDRVGCTG